MAKKKVAELLIDVLEKTGIERIYGVPGDSLTNLPVRCASAPAACSRLLMPRANPSDLVALANCIRDSVHWSLQLPTSFFLVV
jgi:hypothetical protein